MLKLTSSTGRCRLSACLLLLLLALLSSAPLARSQAAVLSTLRLPPDALAFGFNLGQSYGTSAASLANGTIVPLARVPSTPEYAAVMERLIRSRTSYPLFWPSLRRAISLWLRLPLSLLPASGVSERLTSPVRPWRGDGVVLGEMMAALRKASEEALGVEVRAVAVSTPYVAAWKYALSRTHTINHALGLAGLQPWTRYDEIKFSTDEVSAVLAGEGQGACVGYWCTVHGMEVPEGEEPPRAGLVLFVSLTHQSLYTSLQYSGCYWFGRSTLQSSSIESRFGLDRAPSTHDFFRAMKEHILSQVRRLIAGPSFQNDKDKDAPPFTVLVTGEAAGDHDFTRIVREMVDEVPEILSSTAAGPWTAGVQLLVPEDTVWAGARGAAVWQQARMNRTYCDAFDAKHGIVPRQHGGAPLSASDIHEEL